MRNDFDHCTAGFSRVDLLVICCAVGFLLIVLLVVVKPFSRKTVRMRCEITLANLGERLQQYAMENSSRYPWMISTNEGGTMECSDGAYKHFVALSNVIPGPNVLLCKYDDRKSAKSWPAFSNENLSYFIGIGSSPQEPGLVVAGDRNMTWDAAHSRRKLWWDRKLGLHGDCGNLLLSDGSVLSNVDSNRLSGIFDSPGNLTNIVVLP